MFPNILISGPCTECSLNVLRIEPLTTLLPSPPWWIQFIGIYNSMKFFYVCYKIDFCRNVNVCQNHWLAWVRLVWQLVFSKTSMRVIWRLISISPQANHYSENISVICLLRLHFQLLMNCYFEWISAQPFSSQQQNSFN